MSILEEILSEKRTEVAKSKLTTPEQELKQKLLTSTLPSRSFSQNLSSSPYPAIIAEVKLASPSRGKIREDLTPLEIAQSYSPHAACLSVLTDKKFFSGDLEYLRTIRSAVPSIPILRKDFIIDSYQVWETKEVGADALLLIVAALSDDELFALSQEANSAGLEVLVEVHTEAELTVAVNLLNQLQKAGASLLPMIGVNNRDLKTFNIDLETSVKLCQSLANQLAEKVSPIEQSKVVFVAESGLYTGADLAQIKTASDAANLHSAFLIGESLLKSGDPGTNLAKLIADARNLSA